MLQMRQNRGVWDVTTMVFLEVFYRRRIRNVSISQVRSMAGISELGFHEQPQSEDVAPVNRQDRPANWVRWFEHEILKRFETTGGGLEIIADVFEGTEDQECFGLVPTNSATEDSSFSTNPLVCIGEQKEHLRQFLEQLASRMGLNDPDIAASAAVLVIERTIQWARATGSSNAAQTARLLFQCLQHA
jgi:hypothetical protein